MIAGAEALPNGARVRFLSASSGALLAIEVEGPNGGVLLEGIFRLLSELGVQVKSARAHVDNGQIAERFEVSEPDDAPLTSARHREIQARLIPLVYGAVGISLLPAPRAESYGLPSESFEPVGPLGSSGSPGSSGRSAAP